MCRCDCGYDGGYEKGNLNRHTRNRTNNFDHLLTPNSNGHERLYCCGSNFSGKYARGNLVRHNRTRTVRNALYILGAIASALAAPGSRYNIWSAPPTSLTSGRSASIACLFVYTTSTTLFYHASEGDKYRDHWLVGGIVGGISIGLISGFRLQSLFVNILPWTILVSLLLSSAFHQVLHGRNNGKWALCDPEPHNGCHGGGGPDLCEKTSAT